MSVRLAEDHPGHSRVLGSEFDMAHEHGFHRRQRRFDVASRLVDSCDEPFRHPLKDGFPDRVFTGEVTKQCALRHVHVFGNGGRSDLARILIAGQFEHRLDGYRSAFGGGNAF